MRVLTVIPARYASTRLPGKPLLDICGKPMIQHVYDRVRQAHLVGEVLVATDDARIAAAVESFGGKAVLTSPECASGTDRLAEVARSHPADIYLNIQGDEPLLRPADVDALVVALRDDPAVAVATLCYPISADQAANPALVKVVRDFQGRALYFSRAAIPFVREGAAAAPVTYLGHAGMYAYRRETLYAFSAQMPSPLEQLEKLEQLRLLQLGVAIQTVETTHCAAGVDTVSDLERVRATFEGKSDVQLISSRCEDRQGVSHPNHKIDPELTAKLRRIKLVITDVDGVLTDGSLYYGPDGECLKRFHARDGVGVKLLQKAGIQVAVLSGRDCPALRARLKDLGITIFRLGQHAKGEACRSIIAETGVSSEESLFIGDDLPDLEAFENCGVRVAVGDAVNALRQKAEVVLSVAGGQGAVQEMTDILRLTLQEGHNSAGGYAHA